MASQNGDAVKDATRTADATIVQLKTWLEEIIELRGDRIAYHSLKHLSKYLPSQIAHSHTVRFYVRFHALKRLYCDSKYNNYYYNDKTFYSTLPRAAFSKFEFHFIFVCSVAVECAKLEFDMLSLYHTVCPEVLNGVRDDLHDASVIENPSTSHQEDDAQ